MKGKRLSSQQSLQPTANDHIDRTNQEAVIDRIQLLLDDIEGANDKSLTKQREQPPAATRKQLDPEPTKREHHSVAKRGQFVSGSLVDIVDGVHKHSSGRVLKVSSAELIQVQVGQSGQTYVLSPQLLRNRRPDPPIGLEALWRSG